LSAGLALLLFGLWLMQAGLVRSSGPRLSGAFRPLSTNHARAALAGLAVSAFTQSSTAVSVITVGLVHSRLLGLSQAVAVILGANVGTTLTVQFMAARQGVLSLPLMVSGFFFMCSPLRAVGKVLAGLGMIFSGLDLLNAAVLPLQRSPWFAAALVHLCTNPLLAVAGATILTAFLHSSSAATGIVMALHSGDAVTLEAAVALILGNNIGTCFTALIASISSSTAGRRVAAAHLLINAIGAVLCLPLIHPFSMLVAATTSDPGRQVANAHTIFNVIGSLALLPFCGPFARLLTRLLPEKSLTPPE
jgi:phosphate:Na+ symporter